MFRYHGVRDCSVNLERMSQDVICKFTTEKKKLLMPMDKTLRSNVSWFPNVSQTKKNSADALSALAVYQDQNCVLPRVTKSVIRQRAKSMFVERSESHDEEEEEEEKKEGKKLTMDDFHVELSNMYDRPNRGLRSGADRVLTCLQPKPLSDCQKLYNELKAKLAAKRLAVAAPPPPPPLPPKMKVRLSWDQLKALEPKKYPLVKAVGQASWTIDAVGYKNMNKESEQLFKYV